ncbi:MAG: P-loop NTPase [Clostridia bacterium]|nr:P-loop NTPase [Clostridia bacterium]
MAEKIIVASGKGGAGKTSFSAGLAMALTAKGHTCLIVDCDIGQGCVEYILGETDSYTYNWGDALKEHCSFDECAVKTEHCDFIPAPKKNDEEFTQEKFCDFINHFDEKYEFIIFDSPAGTSGGFRLASKCADRGIVISTPDEICVMAASRAADELIADGVSDLRLVINRFNRAPVTSGKMLNVDETIDAVRLQLIGVVPEDKLITYAASGGMASLNDCPAKAAYARIAERVLGNKVNLVLTPTKKEKPSRIKPWKVVLSIFIALIVIACGFFTVDLIRCRRLKEPVFAQFTEVDEDGASHYTAGIYNCVVDKENAHIVYASVRIGGFTVSSVRAVYD